MAAAYQQALRPRLLVPVAMAALLGAINLVSEEPLPLVYQGCALGGFLSYKLALLLETFQQNSLKVGAGRAGAWAVCAWWSGGRGPMTCCAAESLGVEVFGQQQAADSMVCVPAAGGQEQQHVLLYCHDTSVSSLCSLPRHRLRLRRQARACWTA